MVLDYSEYIEVVEERNHYGSSRNDGQTTSIFANRGWYPFCEQVCPRVHSSINGNPQGTREERKDAWSCTRCGWWELQHTARYYLKIEFEDATTIASGVLRSFETDDINVPVQALRAYLSKCPNDIYQIYPQKMERLIQAIFEDFLMIDAKRLLEMLALVRNSPAEYWRSNMPHVGI